MFSHSFLFSITPGLLSITIYAFLATIVFIFSSYLLYISYDKFILRKQLIKQLKLLQEVSTYQISTNLDRLKEIANKQTSYKILYESLYEAFDQLISLSLPRTIELNEKSIRKTRKIFWKHSDIISDIKYLTREIHEINEKLLGITREIDVAVRINTIQRDVAANARYLFSKIEKQIFSSITNEQVLVNIKILINNLKELFSEYQIYEEESEFKQASNKLKEVIEGIIILEKTMYSLIEAQNVIKLVNENLMPNIQKMLEAKPDIIKQFQPPFNTFKTDVIEEIKIISELINRLQYKKLHRKSQYLIEKIKGYEFLIKKEVILDEANNKFFNFSATLLKSMEEVYNQIIDLMNEKQPVDDLNRAKDQLETIFFDFKFALKHFTERYSNTYYYFLPSQIYNDVLVVINSYQKYYLFCKNNRIIQILLLNNDENFVGTIKNLKQQVESTKLFMKQLNYKFEANDYEAFNYFALKIQQIENNARLLSNVQKIVNETIDSFNSFKSQVANRLYRNLLLDRAIILMNNYQFKGETTLNLKNELEKAIEHNDNDYGLNVLFNLAKHSQVTDRK